MVAIELLTCRSGRMGIGNPWVEEALGSMLGGVAIVALSESRNPCAAKASMA